MSIRLRSLKNEVGVYTRSHDRFLAIARALNEPCVWLTEPDTGGHDYEVVIIDSRAIPDGEKGDADGKAARDAREASGWQRLVVYQCQDEAT